MNPFTDSTVALPLPKNHPNRRWTRSANDDSVSSVSRHGCPDDDADKPDLEGQSDAPQSRILRFLPYRPHVKTVLPMGGRNARLFSSSFSVSSFMIGLVTALGVLMPAAVQAVDLNQATVEQLQTVSGIGPKTAQTIVDERKRGGNYASLTDLSDRVKGIGPKKATALQASGLKVSSAGSKADSGSARKQK